MPEARNAITKFCSDPFCVVCGASTGRCRAASCCKGRCLGEVRGEVRGEVIFDKYASLHHFIK